MEELKYKTIIEEFINNTNNADEFIDVFMQEWKMDRDSNKNYDDKFHRLIDRIFTSCDCYRGRPENIYEISESQLREEVSLLHHIWFG